MNPILAEYIREKSQHVNEALEKFIPLPKDDYTFSQYNFDAMHPKVISEAMRYSLLSGGKGIRPVMLMAAAEAVGGEGLKYLPVACGVEMIHAYSLIHDDLPAMDNDDLRRGKPTNHKVYGEGLAMLAGDGLLTAAFEIMLTQKNVQPELLVKVVKEIAAAAGPRGMVAGQAADLISEGKQIDAYALKYIHQAKTGAMFKAAVRAGATLAGAKETELKYLTGFAECFGLLFQITDDILDVTGSQEKTGKSTGSDERNQKATYVTIYSLDQAQSMAEATAAEALSFLEYFGAEAEILRELVKYLLKREV